ERYRDRHPSFNDDIQGTGAVALAGVLAACHVRGDKLSEQRVIVHGAGAGGVGVASAIREGMVAEGLSREEATARVFVLDSRGLLLSNRNMEEYKRCFAQDPSVIEGWEIAGSAPDLLETATYAKATILLGLSGQAGAFTLETVGALARNTERPIIFPLSNPTSSCEALPADIFEWTDGRALVA